MLQTTKYYVFTALFKLLQGETPLFLTMYNSKATQDLISVQH